MNLLARKRLVPVTDIKSVLMYDLQQLAGAMRHPFAAAEVTGRLTVASRYLERLNSDGKQVEFLIWDAYRTAQTQEAIYDRYTREVVAAQGISYEDAYVQASSFVSVPIGIFPHGTGGAVDVTLLINGQPAEMGTGFDAFIPEAAANWYRDNPPCDEGSQQAAMHREWLRAAMEHAGFVGLDSEWWHFEWGTTRWAEATGQPVVLEAVLPPPEVSGPALPRVEQPYRQPVWHMGSAQVFADPAKRAAALLHEETGHYYARTSHPTVAALGEYLQHHMVPCSWASVTATGLAACAAALKSSVPSGGSIVYDAGIYYEVEREMLALASERRWNVIRTDFTDVSRLAQVVTDASHVDVLFCDTPRNWWLECLDIEAVAAVARAANALLIVDISVQPLQDLFSKGADVVVCSLSKYPSLSFTLGGVVLCNRADIHSKTADTIVRDGTVLSPDAAVTIWTQIVSLRDRLGAVSQKAEQIAEFLSNQGSVRRVRVPRKALCGRFTGGQVTFHVSSYAVGSLAEKIVGHNATRNKSGLHLACTFGSAMTTFEHFASNLRHRTGLAREATNEIALPDDIIRLGVGCEPVEDIISDLAFVLDSAVRYTST